ncbi:arylsulfatase [Methyloceanibacter methanicus]|uniref:Arylsulfatase n=1 Tax=Methyloceanibacter methanicus TaxID=1774968 RepID=A0A1E3W2W4_9HYPH|nr:arylsulfatase [Methyloceanibacter methanicus]ODS00136.1 arylsulfatase [Methyloceanibacter methanicus]
MVLLTRGLVRAGLATAVAALLSVTVTTGPAFAQEDGKETETSTPAQSEAKTDKPNILVIWGDDIGTWNISHTTAGMMGYKTPNIDRIADEGLSFTDYYGQQSCTAGRAAFLGGNVPVRTGMTKVGLPGAKEGWQEADATVAAVLKSLGYVTGQFGKNHQGDLDEHLPTNHGFDEFFGNLYHLNAEEEPENEDYPKDPAFREKFGPRGVIHSWAQEDGTQKIEDTGPLTKKRMETVDDETLAAAKDFIKKAVEEGKPFFVWWNGTRMHFRTHVKEEHRGISGPDGDEYHDGMVEHDMHVGQLLDLLDELGVADNTIVFYSTDNGPHYNTWPDAGITPYRSEKNSNWEGAYRVPAFVRWPGHFPEGETLNGIVSHEDWLPTFAAAAGNPDVKAQLAEGTELIGREYRNYIDGNNMLPYFSGEVDESPRKEFIYVNDDGQIVAIRYDAWKAVFLENRAKGFQVWREPFVELRIPLLFNLRRDPFERAQHNANTYDDWMLDRAYVLVPMQGLAGKFLQTMQDYPPSQTPGAFNLSKIEEKLKKNISGH